MYSKVDAKFWCDEKAVLLSPDAKLLFIYLLSSPHRNVVGCYVLPLGYAIADTGMPERRFSSAWRELTDSGMVTYEEKTRLVLVKNFLRYNPIEGSKQVTGAIKRLENMPKSDIYKDLILVINSIPNSPWLSELTSFLSGLLDTPCDRVSGGVSHTLSDTLCDTHADTSKQITENREKIKERGLTPPKEKDPSPVGSAADLSNAQETALPDNAPSPIPNPSPKRRKPSALSSTQEARFNRFWATYPRKVSLGEAEKAWAKIEPDDELTEQIVGAVVLAKAKDSRFREERFTPHPATWLNDKSWLNEYSVAPPGSPVPPGEKFDTLSWLRQNMDGG